MNEAEDRRKKKYCKVIRGGEWEGETVDMDAEHQKKAEAVRVSELKFECKREGERDGVVRRAAADEMHKEA